MRHINMYANEDSSNSYLLTFAKQNKHICININLFAKDMHINSQILLPLFVTHQQRGQSKIKSNKFFSPFMSKKQRDQEGVIQINQ